MGTQAQKKKIMAGMTVSQARPKFLKIWAEMQLDREFPKEMWAVMEVWFRLRSRSETFDMVAQAFAEKVARLHKQKRHLEVCIHAQRLELKKRCAELERAGAGDTEKG